MRRPKSEARRCAGVALGRDREKKNAALADRQVALDQSENDIPLSRAATGRPSGARFARNQKYHISLMGGFGFRRPLEKRILCALTELLERAVEAARSLPPAAQDEIARLVLLLAGDDEPQIALSGDERAAFSRSKAAAARGEFTTDERAPAVRAKHGL